MSGSPRKPKQSDNKAAVLSPANDELPEPELSGSTDGHPSVSSLLAILKASIKQLPANVYALGVVGIVAAATIATILAGGKWFVAVVSGVIMFAGMVILRIFAGSHTPETAPRKSAQAQFLTWICLLAFTMVLVFLVARFFFMLFPQSSSQTSPAAEKQNATTPTTESVSQEHPAEAKDPSLVPVKITVVRGSNARPLDQMALTVTSDGYPYQSQDFTPNREGIVTSQLRSGKFRISTPDAMGDLEFEVTPPQTTIRIKVNLNNELAYDLDVTRLSSETVELTAGRSRWVMGDQIHLSLIGTSYEGDPSRDLASFAISDPSGNARTYEKKAVGTVVRLRNYEVDVIEVNYVGSKAKFLVSKVQTSAR